MGRNRYAILASIKGEGVYLLSLRNKRNYKPVYVGITKKQSFRKEVFSSANLVKVLKHTKHARGKVCVHLLAKPKRRIGICRIDHGSTITLNQWLVREGWALNFEPYAKGRFKVDQDDAGAAHRGLWGGCFAAPRDFRRWNKTTAKLLGSTCPNGDDTNARNALFPDDPRMPPGCPIKGKIGWRAKLTGHRGIYHLEGCRSYRRTKSPNRWFCSEEDAQAAKFRKSFTC